MESHEVMQPAPAQEDPRIGQVLQERYKIIKKLGEGGMGAVYEGEHVLIKRRVAIKCLHAQFASSGDIVARFHREAVAATSIGNEHIIEVTDMGRFPDGAVFMVLEYLNGHDLSKEIEENGPMTIGRVVHICTQVCEALGAAHEKGIVHRDLKPENVFLIRRGEDADFVKVLDFGISKFKDAEGGGGHSMTRTGMAMGTPYYMAPEQAHGHKDLDHRVDVYALGIMMFRALTGLLPFDDESYPMLMVKICTQPPPSVRHWRPDAPPELEAIINKLLAKDKNERFPDCASVKAALAPFRSATAAPVVIASAATMVGQPANIITAMQTAAGMPAPVPMGTVVPTTTQMGFEPRSSSRMGLVLGLLAIVSLAGAVALVMSRRTGAGAPGAETHTASAASPAAQPAPAAAPVAPVPAAAPAAAPSQGASGREVHVQIRSAPEAAELFLDGMRIANPFDADLPQTTVPRRLEARMSGHTTYVQDLVLQFSQRVVIRMQRGAGVEDHRAVRTPLPPPQTANAGAEAPQPEQPPVGAAPAVAAPPANGDEGEHHHGRHSVSSESGSAGTTPAAPAAPPAVVIPPAQTELRHRRF